MKVRQVVMILFYDDNGKIMLQDRRKISKWGEEYGFFGGGVEKGESPEEAIKREIKEELNLDLKDFNFFKHFNMYIKDYGFSVSRYVFLSKMSDLFKIKCEEGSPIVLDFKKYGKLKMPPGDHDILKEIYNYLLK